MGEPQPVDLERDVIPFLRAFKASGLWGSVNVVYKEGEAVALRPSLELHNHDQVRRMIAGLSAMT